ncbi:hypothetical protein F0562_016655 [Nyssa sinensis]|uniref:Uncharacterized protein n=1 Tax=Nyssa sinensis TaxID=561372 RepID=A0A5J4ZFC5_9ASTE|nr:hypothetical protein F0562_016655 [Nyssa sinensis]
MFLILILFDWMFHWVFHLKLFHCKLVLILMAHLMFLILILFDLEGFQGGLPVERIQTWSAMGMTRTSSRDHKAFPTRNY